MEKLWYLYILRCADGTLYTGITVDVDKRYAAHVSGKGAKYTRSHKPVEIAYRELCGSHSEALRRELEIKALSRQEKEKLLSEEEKSPE